MTSDSDKAWVGELLAHRQVVPRWHTPEAAAAFGERDSNRSDLRTRKLPVKWLNLLAEQAERGELHALVEREETAFILSGRDADIGDLAAPLLGKVRSSWARASGLSLVPEPPSAVDGSGSGREDVTARIGLLRQSLRETPGQPLLWSELSRNYLILGSDQRADKAMQCALQLARRNSYLRRSAARLYLHLEQPDRALEIVRTKSGIAPDPRLLAAEIALSKHSKVRSNWGRASAQILADANYRPRFVSDLSAALATVEMTNGKHKAARKLFASSMEAPSENSLAQVQWASERDSLITIPAAAWQTPFPHEARALAARFRCDWDGVLDASEQWLADEPYSVRPAAVGSFASFTDEQLLRAERLACAGLESNPDSRLLLNNRSVARSYLGDLSGAYADLKRALRVKKGEDPVLIATLGLLAYRSGQPDLGSRCYRSAMATFGAKENQLSVALAALFWVREEVRIGSPAADPVFQYLKRNLLRITGGKREPELESMLASAELQVAGTQSPLFAGDAFPGADFRLDELVHEFDPNGPVDASPQMVLQHLE